jgi:hypothetical protein
MARRKTTEPIDRSLLEKLAAGPPELDMGGAVTTAELDTWGERLERATGRHAKARIVMEQFMPFLAEKVEAVLRRKLQYLDAIAPPQN